MNEFSEQNNSFEARPDTVSNSGLMIKTLIGVIIAFAVAIPNLMEQKLFLSFLYEMSGIGYLLMAFVVTAVLGVIWAVLYRTLATDHGPIFNFITFAITSAFAGLFLGNALIFAVLITGYYAEGIDTDLVISALEIATGATFVAVLGGIIALPRLKMTGTSIKFFRNVSVILITLTFVSGITWVIGYLLSMFGFTYILDIYYQTIYGLGPISIVVSIISILIAESFFLVSLGRSKYAVGREPKHMEYYYSIILVNSIIRIYQEIFKLVLKLLVRNNQD